MGSAALLACDWGTTNLRVWTLDEAGAVVADRDFPGLGVSKLKPGEAEARFRDEVRPALGAEGLPAILCGMVGSNLGWTLAPYADAPADLEDLARCLKTVEGADWVRIVPGVRWGGFNGQGDVMRGEETQLFGWLAADPARSRGRRLICHPGTHAKWMLVEDGRLTRFVTAMTGELFAVLKTYSVLKSDAAADDMAAFDAGVAAAGDGTALAARLFTARARVVGEGRPPEETPSYLSGLLIGAEAAAVPALLGCSGDEPLSLLGDARLCGLYARALAAQARSADLHDGEAAAVAGLFALYRKARP
ncbi:2-dehydro-3-deoxygalactonokinase [Phenylobacterium sp.]|uniref:2-dehydro-3-deoxygalactonokinase n=1 Tax=Phenylobacterium sp. TaxID=1871053 RepID=UPI002810C49F|nr:2-dehydro-3-deoxygalactonokinase [Phenylobacterium sp.]